MTNNTILRRFFVHTIAVIFCLTFLFMSSGQSHAAVTQSHAAVTQSHAAVTPNISQTPCNGPGWFTFYTGSHIATKCYGGGGSTNVQLGLVTAWSAGNNYGAFTYYDVHGNFMHQCFWNNNSLNTNNIYVVGLWLYENPNNWC